MRIFIRAQTHTHTFDDSPGIQQTLAASQPERRTHESHDSCARLQTQVCNQKHRNESGGGGCHSGPPLPLPAEAALTMSSPGKVSSVPGHPAGLTIDPPPAAGPRATAGLLLHLGQSHQFFAADGEIKMSPIKESYLVNHRNWLDHLIETSGPFPLHGIWRL